MKWYWWGIPLFAAGMYFVFGRVDKHMTQAEAKVGVPPTSQGHLHTPPAPSIHHVTAPTAHYPSIPGVHYPVPPALNPDHAPYDIPGVEYPTSSPLGGAAAMYGCAECGGMGSVKSWFDLDEDVSEFEVQPWQDSYGDVGEVNLY